MATTGAIVSQYLNTAPVIVHGVTDQERIRVQALAIGPKLAPVVAGGFIVSPMLGNVSGLGLLQSHAVSFRFLDCVYIIRNDRGKVNKKKQKK
jgi:hypothetical protein